MKARIFCPTHGRLDLDDVIIKNGEPICKKCSSILVFGDVKPRMFEDKKTEVRHEKPRRKRLKK